MTFTGDVVVRQTDPSTWRLVEPLTYTGARESFTVPAGSDTDFASVPRAFIWLLPRYGDYTKAAILHDHLVETRVVSRKDADGIFRRAMRELGVSIPRRFMVWAAVRLASAMSGATGRDWVLFVAAGVPALLFVVLPAAVVQLFLLLFWLVEAGFWAAGRFTARPHSQPADPRRAA